MSQVMLIDDDPIIYDLTNRILKRTGCQVAWAKNGQDALVQLNDMDKLPDLILCDIMMPDMDGRQTLNAIRQNSRLRDLPVIILTAHDQLEHLQWAEDMDVAGYIVKPFHIQRFLEKVRQYLDLAPSDTA
ncbi:MAG: response regulator [Anaerolineae bacterium]|nr:response regulator [Anaerolineae bacterium]